MTDIIRVLRLVQYVGAREDVERQVSMSLHGTKIIQRRREPYKEKAVNLIITAITIGEFPETLTAQQVNEFGRLIEDDNSKT